MTRAAGRALAGRVAIVVGAGRGIGAEIARRLAADGASVMLGDRDLELVTSLAAELNDARYIDAMQVDIGDPDGADTIVGATIARFGKVDIIVQNAAIYPWTLIGDISVAEWDQVLGVNLRGAFLSARAALGAMRENGGRVIFISSITGPRVSSPGHGHYSASKAGINGFMKTAALEFAPYGITVNSVEPGNILTEGIQLERSQEFIGNMCASVPLGRLGSTRDVAAAVSFLASDDAAYITGTSIVVDGGQIIAESKDFRVRQA